MTSPFASERGADAPAPPQRSDPEGLLRWLAHATAPLTGEDFFRSLMQHLAQVFGFKRAFIAECLDKPTTRVAVLAHWTDEGQQPRVEFDLAGTPCQRTIADGRLTCIASGLSSLYASAARQGVDGYLGVPIFDAAGREVIGHLAFKSAGPIDASIADDPLLSIFVSRAAAELRRKRAEDEGRRHLRRLAQVGRVSAMGQMASAIAHEINQPLTAVRTYAQACQRLLAAGAEPAELALALERVAAQAERAGEVVRRLRAFMAQGETEPTLVEPNAVVREAVQLCRADAARGAVAIELALAQDLPALRCDPIQLEQVLLNLVRNAIEAVVEGPATRRWVGVDTAAAGAEVRISVRDGGPGVEPAAAARLFEAFHTSKPGGMGIGLAISRSIVESHQGRLWHDAAAGPGACFHLQLPGQVR